MAKKPSIAIIGPGRLGTTLARELKRAGYHIGEIVSRQFAPSQRHARKLAREVGARPATAKKAQLESDVVWFCVADRDIEEVSRGLSQSISWKKKIAFHSSGALASDELNSLRRQGAMVASVHPLMTFVKGSSPSFVGVPFALEGDSAATRVARGIVRDLGGESFPISLRKKAAYHAWGAFTSPLLIAALVAGEQVAKAAGISPAKARKMMMPIVKQTLANYAVLGPGRAFSGPLVRGDVMTVNKHLEALRRVEGVSDVYSALARVALAQLPVQKAEQLAKALKQIDGRG